MNLPVPNDIAKCITKIAESNKNNSLVKKLIFSCLEIIEKTDSIKAVEPFYEKLREIAGTLGQ
jgi:hypothetical protein